MSNRFAHIAQVASEWAGNYLAFLGAFLVIIVWAVLGPVFAFSSTWQLVINTGTTIVTFLMVFLVQNSQNRDSEAVHIKLDAILDALANSDRSAIDAEDDTQEHLDALKRKYAKHQKLSTYE
ncbi:MAG: low affinity iron permease family protein [Thermomicrobiales bacterium]